MSLLDAARALRDDCDALDLAVDYVYNPLRYAWDAHAAYARRFGAGRRRVLLVGMNPGPHGMGQTGVPFGDVVYVRDWMGLTGRTEQPARPHPKRPVLGFAATRREASGKRLYGWAEARYGTAERFFADYYIANYCPLIFFDEEGRNLTPPQLRRGDTEALYEACDRHLAAAVRALRPGLVVGVGAFAAERAAAVVETHGLRARVGTVLHPSPASPAANRGWDAQATRQLAALGVAVPEPAAPPAR